MTEQTFVVPADETKSVTIEGPGKYTIELAGPGAHADIGGHFLLKDKADYNVEIYVVHKAPHTTAQTTLKGVAFDNAKLRFFGRIIIEPDCPNVQSFLEERILLLSDNAKAEAVPELEILSDDVKCSHAASISRVPEEHLFYLQSRGLSPQAAEDLIVQGFLKESEEDEE